MSADMLVQDSQQIVTLQNQSSCFDERIDAFGIAIQITGFCSDDFESFQRFIDIDRKITIFGEIVSDVRATMVNGYAIAEKWIGKFFRPMMKGDMVFDC
jgi:hypothetical protein